MSRSRSASSRVQTEAPRPKRVSLARAIASSRLGDAEEARDRPEDLLVRRGAVRGDVGEHGRRVEVAGAVEPRCRRAAARARGHGARTWSSTSSGIAGVASGPTSTRRIHRVADLQRRHLRDEEALELARRSSSCTMKRLAAMQDWPLLIVRALTAVATAASRSALGMTMNGSLPPSSSTVFLIWAPGRAADAHARRPRCRSASRRRRADRR